MYFSKWNVRVCMLGHSYCSKKKIYSTIYLKNKYSNTHSWQISAPGTLPLFVISNVTWYGFFVESIWIFSYLNVVYDRPCPNGKPVCVVHKQTNKQQQNVKSARSLC